MNRLLGTLGIIAAGFVGFVVGKKSEDVQRVGNADATFFVTTPGSGGFVEATIRKVRMKGRAFHWNRNGVRPAAGSHFEIRAKKASAASVLVPPIPKGVDSIFADVHPDVPKGTIYRYSLWQVLENGEEKELDDPELEISHV